MRVVRPFDNNSINLFSQRSGFGTNDFQVDGAPNNTVTLAAGYWLCSGPRPARGDEDHHQPYDAQYGHTGGAVFDVVTRVATISFMADLRE